MPLNILWKHFYMLFCAESWLDMKFIVFQFQIKGIGADIPLKYSRSWVLHCFELSKINLLFKMDT